MASNSGEDAQDWQLTMNTVLERNRHMFNNPLMSDIKFTCGESHKELYAHKYVLATSSPVFYAMFYGDLSEKNSVVTLPDTDKDSFKEFLSFLYTDECNLTAESVLKLLYLASKYIIPSLTAKCTKFIERETTPDQWFTILEGVMQLNDKELEQKCWRIIDSETNKAVTSEAFHDINHATLLSLVKRATLNIKEIKLFQALNKWSEVQCSRNGLEVSNQNKRLVLGDAIFEIHFLAMSQQDFVQHVSWPGFLTPEETVTIIHRFNGFDVPTSKWKLSRNSRKIRWDHRCCRFESNARIKLDNWSYTGRSDCLLFRVSKPATFHGVCLFGDTNGSNYDVSLRVVKESGVGSVVKELTVNGTYRSEEITRVCGRYGFDVLLPTSIRVNKHENIQMFATIKGPASCSGDQGDDVVECDEFTVEFSGVRCVGNLTNSKRGQFCQIFISD